MVEIEKFPETWCRMWSADAALAHELLTDQDRQWATRTAGLDTVVGPAQTEVFISKYQVSVGDTFIARTLVIGADLVAYTWDFTRRDGSVVTGLDFNVLRRGKVVDNWTFAGPWRDTRADGPGAGPLTADELAQQVREEADRRGLKLHRPPAVDPVRQTAGFLWVSAAGEPGGIDVLVFRDGIPGDSWSLPAYRTFRH